MINEIEKIVLKKMAIKLLIKENELPNIVKECNTSKSVLDDRVKNLLHKNYIQKIDFVGDNCFMITKIGMKMVNSFKE